MKKCRNCKSFIASQWNPETGLGMCKHIVDRINDCKKEGRIPDVKKMRLFYRVLGGAMDTPRALCWPHSDRTYCRKFELKPDSR